MKSQITKESYHINSNTMNNKTLMTKIRLIDSDLE